MLNEVSIMGRITREPELRYTNSNKPVLSFTIACDRDFKNDSNEKQTDFIDCVAWNGTAEFISKYFFKGSMIILHGRIQIRDWTDKDNNKRRNTEVIVGQAYFGESKRSSAESWRAEEPGADDYGRVYEEMQGDDNMLF